MNSLINWQRSKKLAEIKIEVTYRGFPEAMGRFDIIGIVYVLSPWAMFWPLFKTIR